MKAKEIQRFVNACLIPQLDGYSVVGTVLFALPLGPVLRGFCFEDSEFRRTKVFIWVFVQPLYIPYSYLRFTFGRRLHRKVGFLQTREDWEIAAPYDEAASRSLLEAIRSQGFPHLSKLATPELIVRNLTSATGLWGDPYVRETIAYSLARIGKLGAAKRRLEWLLRSVRREEKYEELTRRGRELLEAIRRGPEATGNLLDDWTKQTVANLKLPS